MLLALALTGARRKVNGAPSGTWNPRVAAVAGALGAGALIGGAGGAAVFGAALVIGYLLHRSRRPARRLTLLTVSAGLIGSGALLSRYPWRSVDGYIGHSPWVQLPALIAIGALAAAVAVGSNP